jgi:Flp pilus assembly protein TadD
MHWYSFVSIAFVFVLLVVLPPAGTIQAQSRNPDRWKPVVEAASAGQWNDVLERTKNIENDKTAPPQVVLLRAVGLMRLSDPASASRVARSALRRDPSLVEAYLTAAEADRQANRLDSAIAILRLGLRRFPDEARLHASLGLGLAVAGRCDEAIMSLEEAMFRRPSNLAITKQLAQCLAATDRTHEAVDLYAQILQVEPRDRAVRTALAEALTVIGLTDSAVSLYRSLWHEDSTQNRLGLAYAAALHDSKRFSEAVNVLRTIATRTPDSASVWYNLGVAAFASGQTDSAIRAYRRAIQLQPSFPEAYFNLGIAFDARGFVEDAVVAFRRCAAQSRTLAAAAYNRIAEVLRNQNRIDDALEYHDQALSFDSDNTHLMAAKGHTLLLGNRFTDAIQYLEPLLNKYPNSADILHALARNYVRIGRREDAETIARKLDGMNTAFASDIREMMK